MSRKPFTLVETLQAGTVEVIRRLWDRGQYRDNEWLNRIHQNWFDIWVEYRTAMTMSEVDAQSDDLRDLWDEQEAQEPVYSERLDGETALGGPMQLSHPTLGTFDDLTPED